MKNFAGMMKQAQELQSRMAEMQAEMERARVEGQSGGGLVVLTLNGKGELVGVKIDASLAQARGGRDPRRPHRRRPYRRQGQGREAVAGEDAEPHRRPASPSRPEAVLRSHGAGCRKRRDRAPHPIAGAPAGPRPPLGAPRRAASRQEEGAASCSARRGAHRSA